MYGGGGGGDRARSGERIEAWALERTVLVNLAVCVRRVQSVQSSAVGAVKCGWDGQERFS